MIKHLSNHTNQMHNIYLLHIYLLCSCYMLRCATLHHQAELTSPLLKTTCCYHTAVIYGYYSSCVTKCTRYNFIILNLVLIYLLTVIGLTPGGSSTAQYTFTHRQYTEQHN